jgi:hypothetical protein
MGLVSDLATGSVPAESRALELARADLRRRQAEWGVRAGSAPQASPLAAALDCAKRREADCVQDGPYIRDNVFRYPADTERARQALTQQIIERVSPGPFEDPVFLEMVARQAASVELALHSSDDRKGAIDPAVLSRILVGTIGEPRSEAYSAAIGDAAVIAMSAGMMEFYYQCAKAVVLAWKPLQAAGENLLSFSSAPGDTEESLDEDPSPVTLLRDTLAAWLYDGRPRSPHSVLPPEERQTPITMLINGAERFVLAHEYGHVLMHELRVFGQDSAAAPGADSAWDMEFEADTFGALIAVRSGGMLDLLPANMALESAELAMRAEEIFDEVLAAATGSAPEETVSHPPFPQRVAVLEHIYRQHHPDPAAADDDLVGMQVPARTLDQIWRRARPQLTTIMQSGIPLNAVWGKNS